MFCPRTEAAQKTEPRLGRWVGGSAEGVHQGGAAPACSAPACCSAPRPFAASRHSLLSQRLWRPEVLTPWKCQHSIDGTRVSPLLVRLCCRFSTPQVCAQVKWPVQVTETGGPDRGTSPGLRGVKIQKMIFSYVFRGADFWSRIWNPRHELPRTVHSSEDEKAMWAE